MSYRELERSLHEGHVDYYLAFAIPNIPQVKRGDDIGEIIFSRMGSLGGLVNGDIIVVASKIVSKAEGNIFNVANIPFSPKAETLSLKTGKSPQVCQTIIDQSNSYIVRGKTIIAKHKLGFMLTSAGVDRIDNSTVAIIPDNPDLSARKIRERLENLSGKELAILISDSEGREDRRGAGAIALGSSGINPLRITETLTPDGNLKGTEETFSDLLSSAANVIIGQRGKQTPVVCLRGIKYQRDTGAGILDILNQ